MRHGNARTKLGRTASHRKALLRNLSIELIRHERIQTTETKAKAIRAVVAKVITLAKRQDLAARRRAMQILPNREAVSKLFSDVGPRFADRQGGYTRIFKLGPRKGDCAPMAIIELVEQAKKSDGAQPEGQKKKSLAERLFGSSKPAAASS